MKTKQLLIFTAILIVSRLSAQEMPHHNPFYVYKTEDEFFSGKATYRGETPEREGDKIIYYTADSKTKRKLDFYDSSKFYFAYQCFGDYRIRTGPEVKFYSLFGGGTKETYCTMGGTGANYDSLGYISELFWHDWFEIYYYDKAHNIWGSKNIEDLLKFKPAILEKYLTDKKESDRKAWKRNKVQNEVRYLKMYIAAKE